MWIAADAPEQPVLNRRVLSHLDLWPEDLDARPECAGCAKLLQKLGRHGGEAGPGVADLFRVHRIVLAGRAGEIPAVQDQVRADHLIDVLLNGLAATGRVALLGGRLPV